MRTFRGDRTSLTLGLSVFGLAFALLAAICPSSVTFHDSGEFALAAYSNGVPHPPGAPTYVTLANLFIRALPMLEPVHATNLFSAFCAALTLGLLAVFARRSIYLVFPDCPAGLSALGGLLASVALLASPSFVEQAIVTEQYSLMTLLLMVVLILGFRLLWGPDSSRVKVALGLGLTAGLAAGNHPSQISLIVLLALLAACIVWRRRPNAGAAAGSLAVGLALGLLIFLTVPLRSSANPIFDWGNVKTFDRLMWAVGRQAWPKREIAEAPTGMTTEYLLSYDLGNEVGPMMLGLGVLGLAIGLRRRPLVPVVAILAVTPYTIGLLYGYLTQANIDLVYFRRYGVGDWHLPIYLTIAGLGAIGLAAISQLLSRKWRLAIWLVPAAAFAVSFVRLVPIAADAMRTADQGMGLYLRDLLQPLSSDSVVAVLQDDVAWPLDYAVYASRDRAKWRELALFNAFNHAQAYMVNPEANAIKWDRSRKIAYLTGSERTADEDSIGRGPLMNPFRQPIRRPALSREEADRRPLVVDYLPGIGPSAAYLVPKGLMFEVHNVPVSNDQVLKADAENRRLEIFRRPSGHHHRLERAARAALYNLRGAYFQDRGLWTEALREYRSAIEWTDDNPQIYHALGMALYNTGDGAGAKAAYERAIDMMPYLSGPRLDLANVYVDANDVRRAVELLREELEINPRNEIASKFLDWLLGRRSP